MHALVDFAKPFRIPTFFLIAGLFLARIIDSDWRTYLDRKVIHFVYFYLLWVAIQFLFKAPMFAGDLGWRAVGIAYLETFIEPFGTLWFIYLLPIFFVVVRLTRGLPWAAIWLAGACLEIAQIRSGWTVVDEFAARFVYFYTGYIFATRVFAFADAVRVRLLAVPIGLSLWAAINGGLIMAGFAGLPFISLGLSLLGIAAVVAAAVSMAELSLFRWLRYCGRHSIVIYVAFFLPMAAVRIVLVRSGLIDSVGTISVVVTIAGVVGALVWFWMARNTLFRFLFERPDWARLKSRPAPALQPAE
jgi:uncharacterized membrane protein YcfT